MYVNHQKCTFSVKQLLPSPNSAPHRTNFISLILAFQWPADGPIWCECVDLFLLTALLHLFEHAHVKPDDYGVIHLIFVEIKVFVSLLLFKIQNVSNQN